MDKNGLSSFLLGLGVGVGIGMLFAPKAGHGDPQSHQEQGWRKYGLFETAQLRHQADGFRVGR